MAKIEEDIFRVCDGCAFGRLKMQYMFTSMYIQKKICSKLYQKKKGIFHFRKLSSKTKTPLFCITKLEFKSYGKTKSKAIDLSRFSSKI